MNRSVTTVNSRRHTTQPATHTSLQLILRVRVCVRVLPIQAVLKTALCPSPHASVRTQGIAASSSLSSRATSEDLD